MPRTMTSLAKDQLSSETLGIVWLLEITTDEEVMRCSNLPYAVTYESNNYEASGGVDGPDWRVDEIVWTSNLVPEPLEVEFDSSKENDTTSFFGRLVTKTWHQRPVKLKGIVATSGLVLVSEVMEWRGRADSMKIRTGGRNAKAVLTVEGGTFRAVDVNHVYTDDETQRERSSTDSFFINTGVKPKQRIPFGISWSKVPGATGGGGGGGGALPSEFGLVIR